MRIGLVGCGAISAVHGASIQAIENAELAGAADIVFEKAQAFTEKFGGTPYHSLEELIDKEKPDVLHICTPHYLHTPMAIYALDHGINVFMEKPPAITWEQLEQLEQAAAGSDRHLGFCFQNRCNPSIIEVKKLLKSGKPGKIKGARGLVTWNRPAPYYTQSKWRGRLETEGGGVLINQSIHTMDLLAYLLGRPLEVEAGISNHHLKGVIEVEDTMEAYIRFADSYASFYATTAYCADVPPLIEVCCENMTIRIENLDVTYFYPDGTVEKPVIEQKTALGKSYWGSGHKDCITAFYHAVETGSEFEMDLDNTRETIRMMLGAYESARENHPVILA